MSRALCDPATGANPDDWFATARTDHAGLVRARQTCMLCPLYQACTDYALAEGIPDGVFGAYDGAERKAIWRGKGGAPKSHMVEYDRAVSALQRDRADMAIALGERVRRGGRGLYVRARGAGAKGAVA